MNTSYGLVNRMTVFECLNIEYIHVQGDIVEAKMNLTEFHSQIHGLLHGGVTIAFGETVAGVASKDMIDPGMAAVGQFVTANHMKSKKLEGYILAKGTLMHKGRTSHVWGIEMRDENDMLISYVSVTNAIVNAK